MITVNLAIVITANNNRENDKKKTNFKANCLSEKWVNIFNIKRLHLE